MTNFIKFCVGLYIMSNKKDINVIFQFSDILLGKLEKVQKFVLDNQKQVFFTRLLKNIFAFYWSFSRNVKYN